MRLSEAILEPLCLRYVVDELPVQSGVARRMLLERSAMTDAERIRAYYEHLRVYCDAVKTVSNDVARRNLQFRLQGLKDIRTTLERLLGGEVLDDIELFEIKHLAMLYEEVEKQMGALALPLVHLPMAEVVSILDPDGLRIATFYIYDSYSERLRSLRTIFLGITIVWEWLSVTISALTNIPGLISRSLLLMTSLPLNVRVSELMAGESSVISPMIVSLGRV